MTQQLANVVVVTGLSGAGKSTALAALEDLGYHAIENPPPAVVPAAIAECESAGIANIALGFGGAASGHFQGAPDALASLAEQGRSVLVIFLDAADEVIARRFSETRRPHPLAAAARTEGEGKPSTLGSVTDAVQLERARLAPLRSMAEVVIDTSALRVHDLRKRVITLFRAERDRSLRMSTRIVSFGFKFGIPSDADLVFDVRFLDNPYFVETLRPMTGEDAPVRDYVLKAAGAAEFLGRTSELLEFLLPRYEAEGKSYLTIAVGCTGGQHRSVACSIDLWNRLREKAPGPITVVHLDAHARKPPPPAPDSTLGLLDRTPRPPDAGPASVRESSRGTPSSGGVSSASGGAGA